MAIKSNKLKKQALREKAERQKLREKAVPPVQKVYVIKKKIRNVEAAIEKAINGEIVEAYPQFHEMKTASFEEKTWLINVCKHLISCKVDIADWIKTEAGKHTLQGSFLGNIKQVRNRCIRDFTGWKPTTHNGRKQACDFVRFLFAKYEVPVFMDHVWWDNSINHKDWFIRVGQGENIRKMPGLYIELTKKEAHYMMQSPRDFGMKEAIRHGQISNIGGNEYLTRQILRTRIGTDFSKNEFWMGVFRWFIMNPMLDPKQYAPITDYIHNQKFIPSVVVNGEFVAAQPNFSIKDRNPETLIKQVIAWHKRLGKTRSTYTSWPSCGLPKFEYETGNEDRKKFYTIKELCTSKELQQEGNTMHHCVSSYATSCAEKRTSIWSLSVSDKMGTRKMLTIDLQVPTKKIMEARGKYNEKPTSEGLRIIDIWARVHKLTVSNWLI